MDDSVPTGLPDGVTCTADLDGVDIQLPGPGISLRDTVSAVFGMGAVLALLTLCIVACTGTADWTAMLITTGLTLPLLLGIFGLGHLRARGTPVRIRIEPDGLITHSWVTDPLRVRSRDLLGVTVETSPPVVRPLVSTGMHLAWPVRTEAHARWLGARLQQVVDRQRALRQGAQDVPDALKARERARQHD